MRDDRHLKRRVRGGNPKGVAEMAELHSAPMEQSWPQRRWPLSAVRLLVATVVTLGVFAAAPEGSTQDSLDVAAFVAVFDDPTSLARAIDSRVSSVIAECMNTENQRYVVSSDARFDLTEVTFEAALDPVVERSFGDLVPRLVEPSQLAIDPDQVLVDPSVLRTDLLVDLDLFNLEEVPQFVNDAVLFEAHRTDVDFRIQPQTEGYAIAFVGYEVVEPDPNLTIVEKLQPLELQSYEVALYGVTLSELTEGETGGCASQGLEVLNNEIIPELERRDAELAALEEQIFADPGFNSALGEWRACVEGSGLAGTGGLETLDDAVALTQARFIAAGNNADLLRQARVFERDLATVDFDCRARSTDLAVAAVVTRAGLPYVGGVENLIAQLQEGSQ